MTEAYFFLYLIYGSVYIYIGFFALQKKEVEVSSFPLVKTLKYLGFFGVAHGLSEWVTMLVITGLYSEYYIFLFIGKQVLKATSFLFLWIFGFRLLPLRGKFNRIKSKLPIALFTFWLIGFGYFIIRFSPDYHINNPQFNTIFLRYVLGFSGGVSSALAMLYSANDLKEVNLVDIAKRYRHMAYVFFVYGILDGVFVRRMDFFPASILNNDLFLSIFGFPIQIGKISVGIALSLLLVRVTQTFSWEQREKLRQLQNDALASEERRKLGMELHDNILQRLYSTGLRVEYLLKKGDDEHRTEGLNEIKRDLNSTISTVRKFLESSTSEKITIGMLKERLESLVDEFNRNQGVLFSLSYEIPAFGLVNLSPENSTEIYYIVQEALLNAKKHAQADQVKVVLKGSFRYLLVTIQDNGVGLRDNYNGKKHFGIRSMEERTKKIKGQLTFEKGKKGTIIELAVPWEEA